MPASGRGYWMCRCSKGGVHPLDRALGIAGRAGVRLTGGALRAVAEEASEKSFAKAAESLGRLCGFAVMAKHAERAAKQAGAGDRGVGSVDAGARRGAGGDDVLQSGRHGGADGAARRWRGGGRPAVEDPRGEGGASCAGRRLPLPSGWRTKTSHTQVVKNA